MRRLTFLFLLFVSIMAHAYDALIDGICYNFSGNEATVTQGYYYTGAFTIPSTVVFNGTEYSVTSIGENAFKGCTGLTSVSIPNSVTSIGSSAFEGCSSLTSITIPNSITSIDSYAFYGCSSLASLTIPNTVTSIGSHAFYGCSSLASLTIPNTVTSIGSHAFSGCSSLASLTIPNSVTNINSSAFSGCSSLTSITIPNSVTSIGGYAFYNCSSLTSLTIPNSVTGIGNDAFYGCSSLTSITIPNSVTNINSSAFSGCFFAEKNFVNNSSVTSRNYFGATIYDEETSEGLLIKDNEAGYCRRSATSVTIPNSVTSIGSSAFSGCSSLTSVTIPNSVTSIGLSAFSGCSSLTSITIPNSVTSIDNYAFSGCSSLTSITIPNFVTSIGSSAFYGCELRTIIAKQENPQDYKSAFSTATYTHAQLYVPEGTYWDYVYKAGWGQFVNIKEMAMAADVKQDKMYMLADAKGCNYSVYDSATGGLTNVEYTFDLDEESLGSWWQVREVNSSAASNGMKKAGAKTLALYNLGAQQYAYFNPDGTMALSVAPVALNIEQTEAGISVNGNVKMFVVDSQNEPTAVTSVKQSASPVVDAYTIDGRKAPVSYKGIRVVRHADGTVRKVLK